MCFFCVVLYCTDGFALGFCHSVIYEEEKSKVEKRKHIIFIHTEAVTVNKSNQLLTNLIGFLIERDDAKIKLCTVCNCHWLYIVAFGKHKYIW